MTIEFTKSECRILMEALKHQETIEKKSYDFFEPGSLEKERSGRRLREIHRMQECLRSV